jgi:5-methyltetrahydrofolate--homocysteine methyltransferase
VLNDLDRRIAACVLDPDAARPSASVEALLDRAIDARLEGPATTVAPGSPSARSGAAVALVTAIVLPAMREVCGRQARGETILAAVLDSAAIVRRAIDHLDPDLRGQSWQKGRIVVATLEGDVHDIGRALLITILGSNGYVVHDLGKQVPVDRIVQVAIDTDADAIGLSALLVSTSRQMPRCVQELDRRGAHVPVLIGGAAINRSFGRRAAILPDGRIYDPAVFYCRDVFEGLATMDALFDPTRRGALIEQTRAEIAAERENAESVVVLARPTPRSGGGPRRDVDVPQPPYWGARRLAPGLPDVWRGLDRNTLFRHHWGGYAAKGADFERLIRDVFEPALARLTREALADGWLQPLIVSGYFPCNASGDELIVYDPLEKLTELTRLAFPRQPEGERLCLADYFRPVGSGERDVVVLQAVSAGPRAGRFVEDLQRSGEYRHMLYVNGLASATAEALADFAHNGARRDLHLAPDRGLRFSWGYAACPDLEEQRKVLPLLAAERQIGLTLTSSANLDPEHSTAAIILHHPEAKYFSVR